MRRLLTVSLLLAAAASLLPGEAFALRRPESQAERSAKMPSQPYRAEQREADAQVRAAAADEQRLAARRVDAATRLRAIEQEASDRATEVSALAERRAASATRLREHAAALGPLLPLMRRLSLFPAETLLAVPASPDDAVRGLLVLRGLSARLEREAAALRQEQAALDVQTEALQAALPQLLAVEARQRAEAETLDTEVAAAQARRRKFEDASTEAASRTAAEAARADTLRSAVLTVERPRPAAPPPAAPPAAPTPPPTAPGRGVVPVAGNLVRGWGSATEAGPATGVSYRPASQARVVAPCAGRVRFAGPFRSYGALVILDCGGGYAFVLAGLARLDVAVGTALLAGEPVGTMPGWDAAQPGPRPALYVELRREGQAIDPAAYLGGRS